MRALHLTIPQVLWSAGGTDASEIRAVPVLRSRIGPGTAASFTAFRGYAPFPLRLVADIEPLAGYLAADLALPSEFRAGDLVLMDISPAARSEPAEPSCWVVAESAGLRVRYVRRARGGLEVASEPESSGARDWQPVTLQGRTIADIVRARIVWIGRETKTQGPGSPRPPGAGD